MTPARLRIGTSSWSSTDWVGPFYPPGTRPERFIEHYASVYDTVEIDATFYRPPTKAQVRLWRQRTPAGFQFAMKTPRVVTHEQVLVDAMPQMRAFVEVASELECRLGPILLQFPYFNRRAFACADEFFERLDRFLDGLPAGPRYAVEVRNRAWVGAQLNEICRTHRVALVWVEQAWMPAAAQWRPLTEGASTDFAYLRWLGDRKAIEKITRTWAKPVIDQDRVIEDWVEVIEQLMFETKTIYGFFNNHFAGHAPASVEQLKRRLAARSLS